MSWTCPECQHINSDNMTKCECGYTNSPAEHPKSIRETFEHVTNFKKCPSCGKDVPVDDKFCSFCGKSAVVLSKKEKEEIQKASKWILAISILFIVFGTIYGFIQKSQADKAYANLSKYTDSQVLDEPINGKTYTVGELKSQINKEVLFVFLTNYFLAGVMFALYFWARRTPFPAMVTALCVYLSVIVLNAIIDPSTIIQGIVIKVIFISALVAGIKSSLVARGIKLQ